MKKLNLLVLVCLLGLGAISCASNSELSEESTAYSGRLVEAGMTTFQYGTHLLIAEDESLVLAVTSDSIELNDYVDMMVCLDGEMIEGYPVENGPDYLNVTSIEVK